jgi:hypothetical protein
LLIIFTFEHAQNRKSSAKPDIVFRRVTANQYDDEGKSETQKGFAAKVALQTEKKAPIKKSKLRFGFSDDE